MMSIVATDTFQHLLLFILVPLCAPFLGGLIAIYIKPNHLIQSSVQHLAAGLVFAAAAIELLPVLFAHKQALATAIGFALGVGLLMTIKLISGGHYHGDADENESHQHTDRAPTSLKSFIAAISVDVTVDGLLIGLGFAVGTKEGQILTLAMTTEVFFLGLSTMTTCQQHALAKNRALFITASSGVLLAAMSIVGYKLAAVLNGGLHQALIAFGLAALLYLVTEELLIEAHESPDEPLETACFFLGFLIVLLLAL